MKEAFIELRTNPPAWINLQNKLEYNPNEILDGFEWNVYTITEGKLERIACGFNTFQYAKEYTEEKGYKVSSEDISAELYKAINIKTIIK